MGNVAKLKLPRKMKKVYKKYVDCFYDGWYPFFATDAPMKKYINRFETMFFYIDDILHNKERTDEELEKLNIYWNFHYGRHHRRRNYKRKYGRKIRKFRNKTKRA